MTFMKASKPSMSPYAGETAPMWIESTVVGYITREMTGGGRATTVSREALVLLDEIEELLSDRVLGYAVRAG
ncbi:hypothetical protein [Streptomyces zaomyceticus]|uniref:hypothetical protein n=1 Tax=Streptomyces zaomyceticus TaxID=68286 RepID=UPI00344089C8